MGYHSVHYNCLTHPGVAMIRDHALNGDRWLTVEKADPEIEVDAEYLRRIATGKSTWPGLRAEGISADAYECYPHPESIYFDFTGCLLHIDGRNQHVVYRIGEYISEREVYSVGIGWVSG